MQMSTFYLNPTREKFESYQSLAQKFGDEIASKKNGAELLIAISLWRISEKYSWPINGEGNLFKVAESLGAKNSKLYDYVVSDEVDPSKLDIWWVSYFATGDEVYLSKIMRYAGSSKEKAKGLEIVLIGAATWSFKSNCRQHEAVRVFALKCLSEPQYSERTSFLRDCIAQNKK